MEKWKNKTLDFLSKYRFQIILIVACIFSFAVMISYSFKSLWYDDIYQIYFVYDKSFFEAMRYIMQVDLNPPLWAAFTYVWLRIAPYGTAWLKLPSILFVIGGIIFSARTGKKAFGEETGILSAIFVSLCSVIVVQGAYSFRCYGILFFFSSMLAYFYVKRLKEPSIKNCVHFGVVLFLLAFTHYFGVLLCVFLGICDFILFLCKKQTKWFFIEYVCAALLELPWVIGQFFTIISAISDFWAPVPTINDFFSFFYFLLTQSPFLRVLFVFSLIFYVLKAIDIITHKKERAHAFVVQTIFLFVPILFLLAIFFYSQIKPKSSMFVQRYFLLLIPFLYVYTASAICETITFFTKKERRNKRVSVLTNAALIILTLAFMIPDYFVVIKKDVYNGYEPFEEVAQKIMSDPDIDTAENVLIFNTTPCAKGWEYYLFQNKSNVKENVSVAGLKEYSAEKAAAYPLVYIYAVHFDGTFSIEDIIEDLSETHVCKVIDEVNSVYKCIKK